MGAKQSQSTVIDPTLNASLFETRNNCSMYRNSEGQEFERYRVQNYGYSDFVEKYHYRIRNQNQFLVNACYIEEVGNTFQCGVADVYDVVIERVGHRLADLGVLTGQQGVAIMRAALRGYHQLYDNMGLFLVKDTMIGFDQRNQVKVWANPKFQLNSLETQPVSYDHVPQQEKQAAMMANILELVNARTRKDDIWQRFMSSWQQTNPRQFNQGIDITQQFIQSLNLSTQPLLHQPMPEPQQQQIQASSYTVSNSSQVKQSQTEAYRQASTGMRKDSQQELTNSIMTKSREVKLNGYGQVDGEGRSGGMQGQGFALLRARAIHSLNMNNGVPGQMTNSVSPMPQMPQILRPKEERGMEIRNVAMVSSYNQPPMVRMNRSHQVLPANIQRFNQPPSQQPQLQQPQLPQKPPQQPPQPQSQQLKQQQLQQQPAQQPQQQQMVFKPAPQPARRPQQPPKPTVNTPSFRQAMEQSPKFPEPRQAAQIIKPNKSLSSIEADSPRKQTDSPLRIQPVQPVKVAEAVKEQVVEVPVAASMEHTENMSRRQPGKIKHAISVESRTTILKKVSSDHQHTAQIKPQPQPQPKQQPTSPQQQNPPTIQVHQVTVQQQQPSRIAHTPSFRQLQASRSYEAERRRIEENLENSVRMIERMEKKMEMSRVSRMSRTSSDLGASVSYRDLKTLLQSVHRRKN